MSGGGRRKVISIDDPDGIYFYDGNGWVKADSVDFRRGIHVIYFDNKRCLACRIYDFEWFPLVENMKDSDVAFWIILCEWFSSECSSELASKVFKEYDVTASPTTLILKDGKIVKKIEGVISAKKLKRYIESVK